MNKEEKGDSWVGESQETTMMQPGEEGLNSSKYRNIFRTVQRKGKAYDNKESYDESKYTCIPSVLLQENCA